MRLLLLMMISFLSSCATYQSKVRLARNLIKNGQFTEALSELKPLADEPSNDQLVYLLDYATALQIQGNYQESNKYFLMADKFADIQDYTSLSLETGSFLFGEEVVQYKGDDYEVILINAMLAINYLSLGDLDNAMVEVRRLNEKLRRFRLEAKRKFTDNTLALYLSAIIYEANQSWDDAAIAYEQVYKIDPTYPPLREDLIRSNRRARRMEAVRKWKEAFPEVVETKGSSKIGNGTKELKGNLENDKSGEIVIIYQQGWGPRKDFRYESMRYPAMYPIWSQQTSISPRLYSSSNLSPSFNAPNVTSSKNALDVMNHSSAVVASKAGGTAEKEPLISLNFRGEEVLFNVERMAVKSLEDQYAALIARRIGGAVVKEVMADQIRQKNQLLGDLALIAMHVSDRADLRQWSTLPRAFKIYRATVPPGSYRLEIDGVEKVPNLVVKTGAKVFVSHRTLR